MNTKKVILEGTIPLELSGYRLDQALARLFVDYSRSQLQQWIRNGAVSVDRLTQTSTRFKVIENQLIFISAALKIEDRWTAQAIPIDVIYEDEHLLVINKPVGLVVHPGAGVRDGTLVNGLLHFDSSLATVPRAGIIHRIDKGTSGLLLIARTLSAHHKLTKMMKAREITREYIALVRGKIISGGTLDKPIGRHPTHRTRMAVVPQGRYAVTHFRIGKRFKRHTLIHVSLETGRTHQIRVHMAAINRPLVGDSVYGRSEPIPACTSPSLAFALKHFKHQALHAEKLTFAHPHSEKIMMFSAPLPNDFQQLINFLKEDLNA